MFMPMERASSFGAMTAAPIPFRMLQFTLYRWTESVTCTGYSVFAVGYAFSARLAPLRVADYRVLGILVVLRSCFAASFTLPIGLTAWSRAHSNCTRQTSAGSRSLAANSKNASTETATGDQPPAIHMHLTKGHSGLTPLST
jgi:hypothetical protein